MRFKKTFFAIGLLCFVCVVMEFFSFALYYITEGKVFSFSKLDNRRAMVLSSMQNGKQSDAVIGIVHAVPHPYLGFVYDPEVAPGDIVTPYGLMAEKDPIVASRDPDTVIIAVTGGSVAEQFFLSAHVFLHKYMENLPKFKGKKIDMIMLGRGMYHQPQQLISAAYYLMQGGRLDMLINLDGFNEITGPSEQHWQGVYPAYPFAWAEMFNGLSGLGNLPALGDVMMWKNLRYIAADTFKPLDFSVTASTLWSLIDRYCEKKAVLAEVEMHNSAGQKRPYYITGPTTMNNASDKEVLDFALGLWEQGSIQLNVLAKNYHFDYFHFLQPNQYVADSKIISDEETKGAYSPKDPRYSHIGDGYKFLENGITKLKSQGENAYSLTGIYKHEAKTVYVDVCCHINDYGNEIMAKAIGAQIAEYFKSHEAAH